MMLVREFIVLAVAHAGLAAGFNEAGVPLNLRALPNSPSGGYAPQVVDCPSTKPTIRSASTLSESESSWLRQRRPATVKPMTDLLKRANIPDFDAGSYMDKFSSNTTALPNIAIAVSGGGYRALLNGAGFLAAADDRTPNATDKGGIGGLLQSATYSAGLSGGGWLMGSIYINNFSSVVSLRDSGSVWQFDRSILQGPKNSGIGILNTAEYWKSVQSEVDSKKKAGYETSITDYWGRALSYQLVNAANGGPSYTFSSIADTSDFKDAKMPFPILVADGRAPNDKIVSLNSTVYEFNPFEMGSWDPTTFSFAPTKYLGSNFSDGSIAKGGQCVRGFDEAGFVMGTSSSLFNTFLLQNISDVDGVPSLVLDAIKGFLTALGEKNNDIAQYRPNPFKGINTNTDPSARNDELTLVDGGEDLQNIPLTPLVQPVRGVDVIIAVDSSADTPQAWPNGTALRATYDRSQSKMANGTLFPPVPDEHTFVNLQLNQRPTFFGCNASNFTGRDDGDQKIPPLVIYLPNAPYTSMSNFTTLTMSYTTEQKYDTIRNGYNAGTQGNGTVDADWPACLACAILSRSFDKTGTKVPEKCTACFKSYCWNGTLDQADRGPYMPGFIISNQATAKSDDDGDDKKSGAASYLRGADGNGAWAVAVTVWVSVGLLLAM